MIVVEKHFLDCLSPPLFDESIIFDPMDPNRGQLRDFPHALFEDVGQVLEEEQIVRVHVLADESLDQGVHTVLVKEFPTLVLPGLDHILGLAGHEDVEVLAQVAQEKDFVLLLALGLD